MSITFYADTDLAADEFELNLSNTNALDLLAWLGYEPDYCGRLDRADLLARLDERLTAPWNYDPEQPTFISGNLISCGRPAGYFTDRARLLKQIALRANDHVAFA